MNLSRKSGVNRHLSKQSNVTNGKGEINRFPNSVNSLVSPNKMSEANLSRRRIENYDDDDDDLSEKASVKNKVSLQKLVRQTKYESNATDGILGYALIITAVLIFTYSLYAFIISKLFMPYTGNKILDWIKDDEYYCCLIPCTMLSTVIFMYFNWVSMKYFRHS